MKKAFWKHNSQMVYSITYDEALRDIHDYAVPLHREFGIPGHLEAVAGQIGMIRSIGKSSFDGLWHMNAEEMKELVAEGWGIGSHSVTHHDMQKLAETEVPESKKIIEDATGYCVRLFTVPGNNDHYPPCIEPAKKAGYIGVVTLFDDINTHETDPFRLCRVPLIEEGFTPFFRVYDAYDRIYDALEHNGWIIDYTHHVRPKLIAPTKEISERNLRRRFEKLMEVGKEKVWFANPDAVIDYLYLYQRTTIEQKAKNHYILHVEKLPPAVQYKELTFIFKAQELNGIEKISIRYPDNKEVYYEKQELQAAGEESYFDILVKNETEIILQ